MSHPYRSLDHQQFWHRAGPVSLLNPSFQIQKHDRIVSAGSCFAQHIGHQLERRGYCHFVTEPAPRLFSQETARKFQYGVYSARYGNVYTTAQLHQLIARAWKDFPSDVAPWTKGSPLRFFDPFRPGVNPLGFISEAELKVDREKHLGCVRKAFEDMDVFVFTLGLTECWRDQKSGAVFPVAPGVIAGQWDRDQVAFHNLSVTECIESLGAALSYIRAVNPKVRIVLTVSPVPLAATYENRHVAVANTYSKSVLRVAAQTIADRFERCEYFPSFEIINAIQSRGNNFGPDCREVTSKGVEMVMRAFFASFSGVEAETVTSEDHAPPSASSSASENLDLELFCEEMEWVSRA